MKKITNILFALGLILISPKTKAQSSWILQAAKVPGSNLFINDIVALDSNVVWASVASYDGGYCGLPVMKFTKTANGGTTWKSGAVSAPPNYTIFKISAIDSLTAWVAAYDLFNVNNGRVYKTTDGGLSWVHQSSATFTSACKFVHFFNANDGVAVGESEIFVTSNGGANWVANGSLPFPYPGFTYFLLNSYEVQGNKVWLSDNIPTVYFSNDKGLTWSVLTTLQTAMEYGEIKGLAFKDSLNGLAIGSGFQSGGGNSPGVYMDHGKFFKTSDGGANWTTLLYSGTSFTYTSRHMAKYDICHLKGTANSYVLSSEYSPSERFSALTTDGGTTWTFIDSTVAHTALSFVSNRVGWSGGYISNFNNGVYKWQLAPPTNTNTNTTAMEEYQHKLNEQVRILYDAKKISVSNEMPDEDLNFITVWSIDGKKVNVIKCTGEKIQVLDTESLSSGVYVLEIGIGRSSVQKKITVQ